MKMPLITTLVMAFSLIGAIADVEYVRLIKVLEDSDQGIIERNNGELWVIEKGVGALSFWRFEGKKIVINSPGMFCGIGSHVILPGTDQVARIWSAQQIE